MDKIARILTDYVIQKGTIEQEERAVYEYGFVITLEMLSCVITCFGIAVLLHTIPEGILFFLVFIPLRSYGGGLHLEGYWSCFLLSCLTFSVIMLAGKYMELPIGIAFAAFLLLEASVYYMYPVEHRNRQVDSEENRHFKKRLRQFLLLDVVLAILCIALGQVSFVLTIAATFFMVAVTMAVGKWKNRKQ